MDTLPQLYKLVGPEGECLNGGSGHWPLPTATEPGDWREVTGPLEPCRNGLHLTDADHIGVWSWHDPRAILYRVETDGEVITEPGLQKYVARRVRLLPRRKAAPAFDSTIHDRAEARRDRAYRKAAEIAADAKAALTRPPALAYLDRVGTKLPPGHPLAGQAAAVAEYSAAVRAIDAACYAAQNAARARYDRTITPNTDPRYA